MKRMKLRLSMRQLARVMIRHLLSPQNHYPDHLLSLRVHDHLVIMQVKGIILIDSIPTLKMGVVEELKPERQNLMDRELAQGHDP